MDAHRTSQRQKGQWKAVGHLPEKLMRMNSRTKHWDKGINAAKIYKE